MKNSPLRITSPAYMPNLGLSICPGKRDLYAYSGPCARDLKTDIAAIKTWGAHLVVTLLEPHEFELLYVENLGKVVQELGMEWRYWPVIDRSPLDVVGMNGVDLWQDQCQEFLQRMKDGQKIFIHCRGGLGRTGTLAARLLIESGLSPEIAIQEVRKVRYGAVETIGQEEYLKNKMWVSLDFGPVPKK